MRDAAADRELALAVAEAQLRGDSAEEIRKIIRAWRERHDPRPQEEEIPS